ncbi:hypothetical protein A33Q_0829 [Indibacter alkaliphilus LW1]|uniref:Uncharacterized protein n=2 Tax=Indibacter TaxID=647744 RepID=S2DPC3_INDAL|nr:hypothetical protein A33Q_0829 [Indibacter alkaliphilus LW1]
MTEMMKIKKISLGILVVLMAFVSSCRDFVEPNVPYSEFDTALYLRTIRAASTNSLTFNFFNLPNSRFNVTVESVDAEEGTTVETVEVRIRHRRLIPGVGLEYTPAQSGGQRQEVTVATISGSEFTQSPENRFKRAVIDIPAATMIQAVGLTADEIEGGDVFEVRLYATDRFGRTFGPDNRSSDVAGGIFYDSPFLYNVEVICPLSDGYGLGQYQLEQTGGPGDPFFGNATRFVEEVVTLAEGNTSIARTFTVNYLGGFTTRPFTIVFSCGLVLKPEESAGAGCGGTTIFWESDNDNLAEYDLDDDSVIQVFFIDDTESSCGITDPIEFTLTKI